MKPMTTNNSKKPTYEELESKLLTKMCGSHGGQPDTKHKRLLMCKLRFVTVGFLADGTEKLAPQFPPIEDWHMIDNPNYIGEIKK